MTSDEQEKGTSGWGWNNVRARLEAGEFVIGLTVTINNLDIAVAAAQEGFHFLWVEMEHSPISLETLRGIVLATRGLGVAVLARVPVAAVWTAKRVLDQGVHGVVHPFVSDPSLARTAAQSARYPSTGLRGSGAGLAVASWPEPGNYYDSADRHMLVVCVVEEERALEHIDEIAATPGLDVVFIGTSDLAFSLGLRGDQHHPKLEAAIDKIVQAAKRHGKYLGRPAGSAQDLQRFREQGFQFFQASSELGLFRLGAQQLLKGLGIEGLPADQRCLY
jgi:2-keto-3-deoxy-L-rhamnonate aldolase RhmA